MKVADLGLLFSGWIIVVFAAAMLPSPVERTAFVLAGLLVEILGLVLAARDHREDLGGRE